jgi:ATP-dependent 26S proteasome regulatory subunit
MDLPDLKNRAKILRIILANEYLEDAFDIDALASQTEGYSGSDLKVSEF